MSTDYSLPENQNRKLLISIDFGTAYSAVAHTIDPRSTGIQNGLLVLGSSHSVVFEPCISTVIATLK